MGESPSRNRTKGSAFSIAMLRPRVLNLWTDWCPKHQMNMKSVEMLPTCQVPPMVTERTPGGNIALTLTCTKSA